MPQLQFKGKQFVQNHHLSVKYHELIPQKDKSLTDKVSLHDNLIIHGDNLKALKALLPTYAGKVKCIYIDPPYNTGNEGWAYSDNVTSPMMKEWLGKVVDREDLTRHDKWLCMMMPRLKLLRELLSEDGAIFISIDDNEQHRLRMLMDEIFGEENFIANVAWEKRFTRSNNAKLFATTKENVLIYRRNDTLQIIREERSEKSDSIYSNPDNDPRGLWTSVSYVNPASKADRPNLVYTIKNPVTHKEAEHPTNAWKYSKDTNLNHIKENKLYWGADGKYTIPRLKKFLAEVSGGIVPTDLWSYKESGTTDEGSKELVDLLGREIFNNPKPTKLIKRIINLMTSDNDIILDSFAGSGTTAQAVLDLSKEDGGNRKFILVECEYYADNITAERVRRVIKGVPNAKDEKLRKGLGGSFSYFELGKPIELENILSGEKLPNYTELARYVFYTATGEEFDESRVDESRNYIGESKDYEIYLFYKPDIEYLKNTALTLDRAKALGKISSKKRLVFAPTKYLDQDHLDELKIDFAQLPFEIYQREQND